MTTHYLTKAVLAPATAGIGALLAENAGCDAGHRLVWTLFPRSEGEQSERDFLYREIDNRTYLIVSPQPPADAHALWQLGPKHYAPKLQAGERYSFILRANPAMAIRTGNARRSLRVDAVMHARRTSKAAKAPWGREHEADAALAWLTQREETIGVVIDRNATSASNYRQWEIPHRKYDRPVRFSSVDYEGMLTVSDPDRFAKALLTGIGKARAFGCGLMLIRRALLRES